MASVGDYLRELRDRRGISLEEISRITRVASSYLEALESDRQSALPAPVFTRGFIRAYCQALGESPDEALARYDGREGGVPAPPRPAAPPSTPAPTPEREARSRSAAALASRRAGGDRWRGLTVSPGRARVGADLDPRAHRGRQQHGGDGARGSDPRVGLEPAVRAHARQCRRGIAGAERADPAAARSERHRHQPHRPAPSIADGGLRANFVAPISFMQCDRLH